MCNPQRAQGPEPLRGPQPPRDSSPGDPAAGFTLGRSVTPPLPSPALPMGPDGSPSSPRRRPNPAGVRSAGRAWPAFPQGGQYPQPPGRGCRLGQAVRRPWGPAGGLSQPPAAPGPAPAARASPSAGSLALLRWFGSASSTCGTAAGRGRWRPGALSSRQPPGARAGARPCPAPAAPVDPPAPPQLPPPVDPRPAAPVRA